jgi:hypothetical protein
MSIEQYKDIVFLQSTELHPLLVFKKIVINIKLVAMLFKLYFSNIAPRGTSDLGVNEKGVKPTTTQQKCSEKVGF